MSQIKKIEVILTDSEGNKLRVLTAHLPRVEYNVDYPINTYHVMGTFTPVHEHTGQVDFTFKGSGLIAAPRKPKKPKPLSKRAQRKLEEERARYEAEEWE